MDIDQNQQTSQNIISQPETQSFPSNIKPKKSFKKIIILTIAFLIVLIPLPSFRNDNVEFKPLVVQLWEVGPTPTINETAYWKTYTSPEGMFSLEYPQDWYFKSAKEEYGSNYQGARVEILFSNKLNKDGKIPSGVEIDRYTVSGIIGIDKCKYASGCEIWTEEDKFYNLKSPLWQGGGGLCQTTQQVSLSELAGKKAILIKSNSDSKYEICKGSYSIQYNVLLNDAGNEHLTLTFGYNNQNQDNSQVLDKFNQILKTFRFSR